MKIDRDLLHKLFLREATVDQQKVIHDWCENSQENEKVFLRERKLFDMLNVHGDEYIAVKRKIWYRISLIQEFAKIAAVVIFVLASVWGYGQYEDSNDIVAYNTINVPFGQRVNIELSDGTDVWLNSGSALTYPTEFSHENRNVKLSGEGYFDVKANSEQPFIINNYAGRIEVFGTTFNVVADSINNVYETALLEGKVRVFYGRDEYVDLAPNFMASLIDGNLNKEQIENYEYFEWIDGLISFRDMSFEDIMSKFEDAYEIQIIIDNKQAKKYNYTGKFRYTDGVEYALRVLQRDIGFSFDKDNDNKIIYIR